MTNYRYIAPCHFGIEKTLSFEVKKIGGEDIAVSDGKVAFSGSPELCAKANICLSTAERVCIVLGQFRAKTFDELFEGIRALPLSEYIGRYDAFPNTGHSLNSVLKSIPACQKIVKKAMAVNLCKAYGLQTMPESGATAQIRFSIMKDEVTLMLDTRGVGLHKRGYRRESNAAPIKEPLAAGIIALARIRENDTVCDPLCGSGTLLIEAGLSTYEKECAKRGDDYQEIFAQQVRETMERRAAGLKPPAWAAAAFESGLRQSTEEEKSDSRAA